MYPQGMTGTEVSPSSLLSLAAAGAVLVFVAGAAFAAEVTAVVSPRDGTAQIDNPGCGFAGGSWSTLAGAKPVDIGFVATLESLGPEPLALRLR